MKYIGAYILEKLHLNKGINSGPKKLTFHDVVPEVDFDNPTDEDAKKLEKALKDAGAFPAATKLDSQHHTYNKWYIGVNKYNGLSLYADVTFAKPYKKTRTYKGVYIDFDVDSFLASTSTCVIYKSERPLTWEKVIQPIADFFGAKFNKDGEFLMPGAKTKYGS